MLDNATTTASDITQWSASYNNFTAHVLGNANYSASAYVYMFWNVSKGPTLARLFLNGTENDKTYNRSSIVNLTGMTNVTGLTVTLYANYSGSLTSIGSGTTSYMNLTNTSTLNAAPYMIKVNTTPTENYSTSQVNYTLNITESLDVSFKVLLPDDSTTDSSESGTLTSDEEINATMSTIANVSPCVRGTASCQTTLVANFRINNTGNVNENITICLNQSINSKITVFGTLTNNSFSSPTVIPNCSYSVWKANQSLPVGTVDEFWIWANFTEVTIYDFAVSELFINSTEAV
jgi:hypothetical protein